MSDPVLIGVDHGYAAMKTAHSTFPSGVVAYEHEPYTKSGVVELNGCYYVVGSGRQGLEKDKTMSDDYYLLTLAAIAKELEIRALERQQEVVLCAGLPLTNFGREKKRFRDYLLRGGKPVSFRFEGREYHITIRDVLLFPQGYSAVLTQGELLNEPSVLVADIGGWTVDLMRLDHRIPNASSCRSPEYGVIRCLDEISEQVRRSLGISLTSAQIESALRGEVSSLDETCKEIIHRWAGSYVQNLLSAIAETGMDLRALPVIFLGGGAGLLKRHLPAKNALCQSFILDDVCLNAKGFERLGGQVWRNE